MDLQQMLAWQLLSICVPLQCTMNLLSQVDTLALPCLSWMCCCTILVHLCCESFTEMFIGAATFTMGAYSTQELIEFCSSKNDEGLPILPAFCGSAIITYVLKSSARVWHRNTDLHGSRAVPYIRDLSLVNVGILPTAGLARFQPDWP